MVCGDGSSLKCNACLLLLPPPTIVTILCLCSESEGPPFSPVLIFKVGRRLVLDFFLGALVFFFLDEIFLDVLVLVFLVFLVFLVVFAVEKVEVDAVVGAAGLVLLLPVVPVPVLLLLLLLVLLRCLFLARGDSLTSTSSSRNTVVRNGFTPRSPSKARSCCRKATLFPTKTAAHSAALPSSSPLKVMTVCANWVHSLSRTLVSCNMAVATCVAASKYSFISPKVAAFRCRGPVPGFLLVEAFRETSPCTSRFNFLNLRRMTEYQWFLTDWSVRPFNNRAISHHLLLGRRRKTDNNQQEREITKKETWLSGVFFLTCVLCVMCAPHRSRFPRCPLHTEKTSALASNNTTIKNKK